MQAVIVAGGLGTRLRPLTQRIPKSMIEFGGKPFLWHVLSLLKDNGFKEILFCAGNGHDIIENYFGNNFLDMKINYSVEDKPLGTGGAIKLASKFLDKKFLLLGGDVYLKINYKELVERFNVANKIGVITVYDNKKEKVADNNVFVKDYTVKSYHKREKHDVISTNNLDPMIKKLNGVACDVDFYNRDILKLLPDKEVFSFEMEVYPKLIELNQLAAFVTSTRYYDIGTFDRIEKFKKFLTTEN